MSRLSRKEKRGSTLGSVHSKVTPIQKETRSQRISKAACGNASAVTKAETLLISPYYSKAKTERTERRCGKLRRSCATASLRERRERLRLTKEGKIGCASDPPGKRAW